MHIGVVGVNDKLADLKLREKLAKTCLRHFGCEGDLRQINHFIVLSTCNRTEVYFQSDDLPAIHSYILAVLREEIGENCDQKLYSYFGQDCLLHLCRVTTGLDSAIVAETEIQGQVKHAYENASKNLNLPEALHYLFQKALKIGKQVRSQFPIQRGLPDLEHAILHAGQHFFNEIDNITVLFVGTSEINRKILTFFKSKAIENVTICNRTQLYAQTMANAHKCKTLEWAELKRSWHEYDWIIFGTKAPEPLITQETAPKTGSKSKLLIDLSVPRNVDEGLARDPRFTLLNIDQLNKTLSFRKEQIMHLLSQAENLIETAAIQYANNFKLRQKQREQWLAAV